MDPFVYKIIELEAENWIEDCPWYGLELLCTGSVEDMHGQTQSKYCDKDHYQYAQ